jgi:hypothetical protein
MGMGRIARSRSVTRLNTVDLVSFLSHRLCFSREHTRVEHSDVAKCRVRKAYCISVSVSRDLVGHGW